MPLVLDTYDLINECRCELARLNELAADFRAANEMNRKFLTGAAKMKIKMNIEENAGQASHAASFSPDPREWRDRADQTRTFAEFVLLPQVKRLLLEIADSYDEMAE